MKRINLDAELTHDVAIDLHPALENKLLPRPPRSDAGIREKFLKAKHFERGTRNVERGKEVKPSGEFPFSAFRVPRSALKSGFRLGFAQAGNPVSVFPLAAFLEQFRALKTLEHIPFAAQSGSRAQTTML
jgi:hypothetical protein